MPRVSGGYAPWVAIQRPVDNISDLLTLAGCPGQLVGVVDGDGSGNPATYQYNETTMTWELLVSGSTSLIKVCITRRITADVTVAAGTTCLQRNPTIVGGVIVKIEATGELLVL